ncbi:hypothetical protein JXO52_17370 [bacterium]|nr:hypothetical protein [bacterium]
MKLQKLVSKKWISMFILATFLLGMTIGSSADIALAIRLALAAIKADLQENKWDYQVGLSVGTDTSFSCMCKTGGSEPCRPLLALM